MHQKQISSTNLDMGKRIFLEANEHVQGLNNKKNKSQEEHHKEVAPDSTLQKILIMRRFNV